MRLSKRASSNRYEEADESIYQEILSRLEWAHSQRKREARKRGQRFGLQELARAAGMTKSNLSKTMSGVRRLQIPEAGRLAAALDVSPAWLVFNLMAGTGALEQGMPPMVSLRSAGDRKRNA